MAKVNQPEEVTGMLAYIIAAREMKCGSVHSKCLLQYYASNCGKDGSFFKSTVDISAETGLSGSFIRKTNSFWETIGILSSIEGSWAKRTANIYQLNLSKLRSICDKNRVAIEDLKILARKQAAARSARYRSKKLTEATPVTPPGTVTRHAVENRDA